MSKSINTPSPLEDFESIMNNPHIKIYYMGQVHEKICSAIWDYHLRKNPNFIPNIKPTIRQKQLNEAIFEWLGITHVELSTFKKVRGNSDIVLKILLGLKSLGIPHENIFFDSNIIKTCLSLAHGHR